MERPTHAGLRHLALNVRGLDQMKRFYVDLLGFEVEWEPDADNVYLSSGVDNLALHRSTALAAGRSTALAAGRSTALAAGRSTALAADRSTALAADRLTALAAGRSTALEADCSTALAAGRSTALAAGRGTAPSASPLDHLGLIVRDADDVDRWAAFLESRGVTIDEKPRTHRDGARSCYFRDPDGNRIQIIHHPPISGRPRVAGAARKSRLAKVRHRRPR